MAILFMHRFKVLAGYAFFLLILFIIISSTTKPELVIGSSNNISESDPNVVPVDFVAVERSNAQKEELELALKAYFAKAIASGEIVGAGVSVVKQGSIIISDGYGKRSTNSPNRINGETVFRLGSLSKGFAGVFVASLEHEEKLGWNNKVVDYLPNFKLGDSINTNKVRLSHILSHTSGAPYHSFTNLVEADLPLQNIAERFNEVAPISEPGLQYSYQNALFALSGEIVESATGQDLAAGLYNRFFKPLGMCSTSMDYKTLADTENVALPHSRRKNGWRKLSLSDSYFNAIAAGGINASAHDMGKWMRFLLGHNPKVLGQPAFLAAFEPFIEIPGRNKYYHRWPGHTKSHYGYGWRIHKFVEEDSQIEKTIWHHGGSVNNYRNEIAVYPEDDLGICVLLNSNSRLARTVIPDLYQIINNIYEQPSARLAQNSTRNESYPSKG